MVFGVRRPEAAGLHVEHAAALALQVTPQWKRLGRPAGVVGPLPIRVAEQARAIDRRRALVADPLSLIQINRHAGTTEACRGVCGSGAHHPTTHNSNAPS